MLESAVDWVQRNTQTTTLFGSDGHGRDQTALSLAQDESSSPTPSGIATSARTREISASSFTTGLSRRQLGYGLRRLRESGAIRLVGGPGRKDSTYEAL